MALAPYTTAALVRNALGVNVRDRSDAAIDTVTNATVMNEAMYTIGPSLPADLAAAIAAPSPTTIQARFRDLGSMYCCYAVALSEVKAAPLFAPKEVKDDRTAMTRIDDPFKNLRDELTTALGYVAGRLRTVYAQAVPGATLEPIEGAVLATRVGLASSPATDIVTSEG